MNQTTQNTDAHAFLEAMLEWLKGTDIFPEEKRAFFASYDAAGGKIDEACIEIFGQSLERQKEAMDKNLQEAEENERLLRNVMARQEQCVPGSLSREILDQASLDMDDMVKDLEKRLKNTGA